MKFTMNKLPRKTIVASVVASAFAFGVSAGEPVALEQAPVAGPMQQAKGKKVSLASLQAQQQALPTYYIIELEDAAIAQYQGGVSDIAATKPVSKNEKLNLQSTAAKSYSDYLAQKQEKTISALQSQVPGVKVERQTSVLFNGMIVSHKDDDNLKAQLEALPGVKRVYEHEMYYAKMDVSNDIINSADVWAELGGRDMAGAGVKVAIIDGGIRSEHPMFADNGHERPEGLPDDDYCSIIDESFCNDKLAVARFYTPTFVVHPDENISPLDFGGHGTHVAGTAAGNPVQMTYQGADVEFSGVAPGATIMAYKALFNDPAGQGGGSNIMLLGALEDAAADGADVINNSWGGGAGGDPASSVYASLIDAAEDAGIVVVTAAGNDGPGATTIGCPSCVESGLSVASTQTGRTFSSLVNAPGVENIAALPGNGEFEITEEVSGPLMPALQIDEANEEACAAFPEGSLEGHIVLTVRGTCAFTDKANNAEAAGAIGMIMYNNADGVISMSMPGADLPSVSILQADGEAILEAWVEGDTASFSAVEARVNEGYVDVMSAFSSRGPNGDSSFLKPEIAAPGSDILSAYVPDDEGNDTVDLNSGTSMASPHVAGAAALLRAHRPELDAYQIKSILMSSSNPNVLKEDAETPADAFDMGAGRLDVTAAAFTGVAFDKPSMVSQSCISYCDFERTVTNLGDSETEWSARVEFDSSDVSGELSASTITLPGTDEEGVHGEASFELNVDTRFAEEGWKFGRVVLSDTSGSLPDAHIPVVVMAARTDDAATAATSVTAGEPVIGETVSMRSRGGDNGSGGNTTVTVRIPEGMELDVDSITPTLSRAVERGFSVAPNGSSFTWSGVLTDGQASTGISPATGFPFAGATLTGLDSTLTSALPCSSGCDEVSFTLGLGTLSFEYFGESYNAVTIYDNGILGVGSTGPGLTFDNQNMPNSTPKNNILAPLWTDFAIGGANPGEMRYGLVNVGDPWLVVEWLDVAEYNSATGDQFSFGIWINLNTSEIIYNYASVPAMPDFSSVGFENIAGDMGATVYFNGQGTAPTDGTAWSPIYVPAPKAYAEFDYDVTATAFGSVEATSVATDEDTAVEVDLSGVAHESLQTYSEVLVNSDAGLTRANLPVTIEADGEVTLEITVEPENGTLEPVMTQPEEGSEEEPAAVPYKFTYTPAAGFSGEDSFSYKLVDAAGNETPEATATVTVEAAPAPAPEPEPEPEDDDKWYEGSFNALLALLALPVVWLRRRRLAVKA